MISIRAFNCQNRISTTRKQYVRYQSCDSEYRHIKCGVPQVFILGPLLFILYVNDIVATTSLFDIILFADDTTLLYSHPDIASKLTIVNKELSEINNWFKANKLSVNSLNSRDLFLNLRRLVKMTKPLRIENKSLRLKYKCLICILNYFLSHFRFIYKS